MPEWVFSLIIAWLPFFVWAGLMWWFVWTIKKCLTTKDGRSIASVLDELSSQLRRSNPAP